MLKGDKIGVTSLARVKSTGKRHYVRLDPELVRAYGIKIGDVLKFQVIEVHRQEQEQVD
jgi:hypothetical protein